MRRLLFAAALLVWTYASLPANADYRFDGIRRVVAFADVHGAYAELVTLLRATGVVDESLKWQAGQTHLVSLGDLLDRGPDSRKVMELLIGLEAEAKEAGGAVHLVLGNHEVMNIVGDLRYVSAEEYSAFAGPDDALLRETAWQKILVREPVASRAEFDAAHPAGYFAHREAFSPNGRYGRWLLSKPFLVTINDTAFVHAGLPPMVASLGLEGTNRELRDQLEDYLRTWESISSELGLTRPIGFLERPEFVGATGALQHSATLARLRDQELFSPTGPTWYRGQALCYPHAEADNLDAALAALEADQVVEGHTVSTAGFELARRLPGNIDPARHALLVAPEGTQLMLSTGE